MEKKDEEQRPTKLSKLPLQVIATQTSGSTSSNGPGTTSPPSISRTERFTTDGKQYISRSTWLSHDMTEEDKVKEQVPEKPKIDWFAKLPDETVGRVLHWVELLTTADAAITMEKADFRLTGWLPSKDTTGMQLRKSRNSCFKRIMHVCKRWYLLAIRSFYSEIDFSSSSAHSYGYGNHPYDQLATILKKPIPILASSSSPPSQTTRDSSAQPPTFGSLVRKYNCSSNEVAQTYFLKHYLQSMPSLVSITLNSGRPLSLAQSTSLTTYGASAHIKSLDKLSLANCGDDQVEQLLTFFNHSPNVEHFGVVGFVLSEALAKRLAFVWKLNSSLIHETSGSLGVGIKSIYFGNGSSIPMLFLKGLGLTAPKLTKLHIKSGVAINAGISTLGLTPFDLREFAMHWGSQLSQLTLVGTSTFSTRGKFDDILVLCPNLEALHLRSDHITFAFFHSINDIYNASLPLSPACSVPSHPITFVPFPSSDDGSDSDDDMVTVTPADDEVIGEEGTEEFIPIADIDPGPTLRLKALAIQSRIPSEASRVSYSTNLPRPRIQPFATNVLFIESRGTIWPSEMGGQRDLLERASWMLQRMAEKDRKHKRGRDSMKKAAATA